MKRDTSKTKTKRARAPRLPNPKESRRTVQFRVSNEDEKAIQLAIQAAAKSLGFTPTMSDLTRMAVTAYTTHARELADATRERDAALASASKLRKQIADLIEERDTLCARLDVAGGGLPNEQAAIDVVALNDAAHQLADEAAPVTCETGRHVLMFDGPCEDCRVETQDGQEQTELAAETE